MGEKDAWKYPVDKRVKKNWQINPTAEQMFASF